MKNFKILSLIIMTLFSCQKEKINTFSNDLIISEDEGFQLFFEDVNSDFQITSTSSIGAIDNQRNYSITAVLRNQPNVNGKLKIGETISLIPNQEALTGNTQLSYKTPNDINVEVFKSIFDNTTNVSWIVDNKTIFEMDVTVPKELEVTNSYNDLNKNSNIRWNADENNKNGVLIMLEELPMNEFDNADGQKLTNYILTKDDGEYNISDLFKGFDSKTVMINLYRGNILITEDSAGNSNKVMVYSNVQGIFSIE